MAKDALKARLAEIAMTEGQHEYYVSLLEKVEAEVAQASVR